MEVCFGCVNWKKDGDDCISLFCPYKFFISKSLVDGIPFPKSFILLASRKQQTMVDAMP